MAKHFDPSVLPEDVARYAQVAAGRFASIEEVIVAGIEALHERDDAEQEWLDYARRRWEEGRAESVRGTYTEMSSAEFSGWLDQCAAELTQPTRRAR